MMDMYDDMAKKGRKGDTYIGHLTGGEMVIPAQILDADEGYLRKVLETTLTDLEVDPAQYTVGSEANKVNPETGQIEFGFGSFFKSVTKPFKKAVKAVGSVLGYKEPKVDDSALKAQQARLDEQERKLEMQQSEAAMQKQASFRARRGRGGSYSLLGGQDTLG